MRLLTSEEAVAVKRVKEKSANCLKNSSWKRIQICQNLRKNHVNEETQGGNSRDCEKMANKLCRLKKRWWEMFHDWQTPINGECGWEEINLLFYAREIYKKEEEEIRFGIGPFTKETCSLSVWKDIRTAQAIKNFLKNKIQLFLKEEIENDFRLQQDNRRNHFSKNSERIDVSVKNNYSKMNWK